MICPAFLHFKYIILILKLRKLAYKFDLKPLKIEITHLKQISQKNNEAKFENQLALKLEIYDASFEI